tara:strand:+ start:2162 stop:3388 length:1227 start_codon:yes stop_codon:yes gene_type:complete
LYGLLHTFGERVPQDLNIFDSIITRAKSGCLLTRDELLCLISCNDRELPSLLDVAIGINDKARPLRQITFSPKVFLPLTNLCRDRCGYCTFVKGPNQKGAHTMSPSEVVSIAKRAAELGCKEALISLGDHPEYRHEEMVAILRSMGFASTPEYVAEMSRLVFEETGLIPHTNCGVLSEDEIGPIAEWNGSMGIMLESTSLRLHQLGEAHYQTTSKEPTMRINTIEAAAKVGIAMTTGILLGIGETLSERIDSLLLIRETQKKLGNIQEVIIQNFRAKRTTRMSKSPEPDTLEMLKTLAVARLIFGPEMNIQAPPNLNAEGYSEYLNCGINDWGGISPLTVDFINPEAAWPQIKDLREKTFNSGYILRERTALYPEYIFNPRFKKQNPIHMRIEEMINKEGYIKQELEI